MQLNCNYIIHRQHHLFLMCDNVFAPGISRWSQYRYDIDSMIRDMVPRDSNLDAVFSHG